MGDMTSHGGVIVTGAMRTTINGKPAARMGDFHSCPIPFHGVTPIVTGSPDSLTEGRPDARVGDFAGCGAMIVTGGPDSEDG